MIAETLDQARAGAALVEVAYGEQVPVVDTATAAGASSAVHDAAPDNVCYVWGCGDKGSVDAAIASAPHVSKLSFRNNRLIPNAIETRACNASYNPSDESYTLYVGSQNPHVERLLMCAFVLGIPEHKLRVVAPEWVADSARRSSSTTRRRRWCGRAGRSSGRSRWTADRSEAFLTDAHGRDHVTTVELGTEKDGTFLAMRVTTTANLGAYLSTFASCVPTILYATLLAGQYRTPKIYAEVTGVFTNTAPVDAYRGAGRPEATYVIERIVETAAHDLGIDPAAIRRKNFITTFPYPTPVGLTYDVGDYEATMSRAIELADVAGFASRKATSEANGLKRGIGYSAYIEACGLAPSNIAAPLGARGRWSRPRWSGRPPTRWPTTPSRSSSRWSSGSTPTPPAT